MKSPKRSDARTATVTTPSVATPTHPTLDCYTFDDLFTELDRDAICEVAIVGDKVVIKDSDGEVLLVHTA